MLKGEVVWVGRENDLVPPKDLVRERPCNGVVFELSKFIKRGCSSKPDRLNALVNEDK